MTMNTLHFTLGPVQGFVAQARRTRDLWAGSFLLSYLSGCAMKAVLDQGGGIDFPDVSDDSLLKALRGLKMDDGPSVGSLPNRFKAKVPAGFTGENCAQAVRSAWQRIAGTVWDAFVQDAAPSGRGVEEIWNRQIDRFWEMNWVLGDEGSLLDRRKNWRTHDRLPEPGDRCVTMGELQELSGYVRYREAKKQDAFWKAIQERVSDLDLRQYERLSAVALVKRLFPLEKTCCKAIGWHVDIKNWPSTAYMAAVPWVLQAVKTADKETRAYADSARRDGKSVFGEKKTEIPCLADYRGNPFTSLEGMLFFRESVLNSSKRSMVILDEGDRKELSSKLKVLHEKTKNVPSLYYAVLLMDGDRLGALLSKRSDLAPKISQALADFTSQAPGIVTGCNGVTIYAGGDDVLAMLPLEFALPAAQALRAAYQTAFQGLSADLPPDAARPTISAGVVFANFDTPLMEVIQKAHRTLDDQAKEKAGRDAIAVSVWKGNGAHVEWFGSWDRLTPLFDFLHRYRRDEKKDKEFSSQLLYRFRELLLLLNPKPMPDTGEAFAIPEGIDVAKLLEAAYLRSRASWKDLGENPSLEDKRRVAQKAAEEMLRICQGKPTAAASSPAKTGVATDAPDALFRPDGLLLVRFLAKYAMKEDA